MATNGIRILYNKDKSEAEQDRDILFIRQVLQELCRQADIYQLELNITYPWQ